MNTNILAPSATLLAHSGMGGGTGKSAEADYNFDLRLLELAGPKTANRITFETMNLKESHLRGLLVRDYRSRFPAIHPNKEKLPPEVYQKIREACQRFVMQAVNEVIHLDNAATLKRSYNLHKVVDKEEGTEYYDFREKVVVTGHNLLKLREKRLAAIIYSESARRSMERLDRQKGLPSDVTEARRQRLEAQIALFDRLQREYEAEIKAQESLNVA